MANTQKPRYPYFEEGTPLDNQTLKQAGNEISINPRVDLFCGAIFSEDSTTRPEEFDFKEGTVVLSDIDEFNKFKVGDIVNFYDPDLPLDPVVVDRNCIIAKDEDTLTLTLFKEIKTISGEITMSKELVIRVSNKNCYRDDEYGFGRFYKAVAQSSDISNDMGELFNYEWNTSDYTLEIQNYDGFLNKYLPGGDNEVNFGGRLLRVWLGTAEENNKNRLIWEGITHLNSGISESDSVLTLDAYHISYVYNKPVCKNRYETILDEDMKNEVIPYIQGDWTTNLYNVRAKNASGQYPGIPAYLVSKSKVQKFASTTIPASRTLGNSLKLTSLKATTNSIKANKEKLELRFFNYTQASDWDMADSWSLYIDPVDNDKKTVIINCYKGSSSTGMAYSSAQYICNRLQQINLIYFLWSYPNTGVSTLPMIEGINSFPNQMGYFDAEFYKTLNYYTETYSLSGGIYEDHAEYSICINALDEDTGDFVAWFTKGVDDPSNWELAPNRINGSVVTPHWDSSNGRVLITGIPSGIDLGDWELYVSVRSKLNNISQLATDSNVVLNIAHNLKYGVENKSEFSKGKAVISGSNPQQRLVSVPDLNFGQGYLSRYSYKVVALPAYPKTGPSNWKIVEDYSTLSQIIQPTLISNQNWVFEIDVLPVYMTPVEQFGEQSLVAVNMPGNKLGIEIGTSGGFLKVYLNNRSKKTIATNNQLVHATAYRIRVINESGLIKIFLKDITNTGDFIEVTYDERITWGVEDWGTATTVQIGYCQNPVFQPQGQQYPSQRESFSGVIGVIRWKLGDTSFVHEEFVDYTSAQYVFDPISQAKELLKVGGADNTMFDGTWEQFSADKNVQSYNTRFYLKDEDSKAIEEAHKLLGQVGIVLTMKSVNNKLVFSLINDSIDYYQNNKAYEITEYDIERGSVQVDREVNQYFNSLYAEYNLIPLADELNRKSMSYHEPLAIARDLGMEHWYRLDEKKQFGMEFKALYESTDIINRIKNCLAISTQNPEKINLSLSWRHLFLEVGDFVQFTYGRFISVPCQVRSVSIDANGSKISVGLLSLEKIKFIDRTTGETYEPKNYDGIGGVDGRNNVVQTTDPADI